MPQVLSEEFKRLPLRVYTFLAEVPLHDVWAVDLSRWRARVTLQGFLRTGTGCLCTPSRSCECCSTFDFSLDVSLGGFRTQQQLRGKHSRHVLPTRIGRIHWPRPDFSASSTAFENERVAELIDGTAHVAALTALIKTPTAYRYYLAVYVWDVSPFTPFYMAMINPCRRRIMYPFFLRVVRARWNQAFGNG